MMSISLILISLALFFKHPLFFWISLLGSIMTGMQCEIGEYVILAYLKVFPAKIVTGWSSGTGFALIF